MSKINSTPEGVRFKILNQSKKMRFISGLFLDRDGVLVEEVGYLHQKQHINLMPFAKDIIKIANSRGVAVIVISNQSGIARGIYDWVAYDSVEEEIYSQLYNDKARIDASAACGMHPEHSQNWKKTDEYWRKPGPGMLILAASALQINLSSCWLIGDKVSDIIAAKKAGLSGSIHLETGHGRDNRRESLAEGTSSFSVLPASDLGDAQKLLTEHGFLR